MVRDFTFVGRTAELEGNVGFVGFMGFDSIDARYKGPLGYSNIYGT